MLLLPPCFGNFFECQSRQSYPNLALDMREIRVKAKRESGLQHFTRHFSLFVAAVYKDRIKDESTITLLIPFMAHLVCNPHVSQIIFPRYNLEDDKMTW